MAHARVPRRLLAVATGLALTASLPVLGTAPAFASGACTVSGTTATVTLSVAWTTVKTIGDGSAAVYDTGGYGATIGVCESGFTDLVINGGAGDTRVDVWDEAGLLANYTTTVDLGTGMDDFTMFLSDAGNIVRIGPGAGTQQISMEIDGGAANGDDLTVANSDTFAIDGGPGNDDIRATGSTDFPTPVIVDLSLQGWTGDDTLYGGDGNDGINGYSGPGTFSGGAGNDLFIGGLEGDSIDGGDGTDVVYYFDRSDPVTVTLDSGTANDGQSGEGDDLTFVENVVGGYGNDSITGNAGDNAIFGGEGNDHLYGLSGNDTLEGGVGTDTMDGGHLNDTLSYASAASAVLVNLSTGATNDMGNNYPSEANGDAFSNFENVIGGPGNDSLTGTPGANLIRGGEGDDSLYGDYGNDTIYGDDGIDTIAGNEGSDVIYGGGGDDTLYGNTENDTLRGGAGNDWMEGGSGNDSLIGEADRDDRSWNCGDGLKDKATFDLADGLTKTAAKAAAPTCESIGGRFPRV